MGRSAFPFFEYKAAMQMLPNSGTIFLFFLLFFLLFFFVVMAYSSARALETQALSLNYCYLILMLTRTTQCCLWSRSTPLCVFVTLNTCYLMLILTNVATYNVALFAVMVYSSTRAIKHLAVPMISVFRNLAPITITLVEWLWMKVI